VLWGLRENFSEGVYGRNIVLHWGVATH
jgi:hypothetical protein